MQVYHTGALGSQFISALVYGLAGAGKTPLAATCPQPLVVTSEAGLLSLKSANLPYVMGRTYKEAMDTLKWLETSNDRTAKDCQTVYYDSISALAETTLEEKRARYKGDNRKMSPETIGEVMSVVKGYLNLRYCARPKHVIMTNKGIEFPDPVTQVKTIECFTPVAKLGPSLPYEFDTVLILSRHIGADGKEIAAFRCRENDYGKARDRSNTLALWEPADFGHIIRKINGA